ncbi:hypothetical protein Maq22A_c28155 [Methylobacterium aquaticum]|uniref:Uncharacterized protein n=1 Tax=Methylobacterium aquaticum TaxID=270351 RepID=A0A1Y0ZCB8_9HYPH|nr:hypothetical protein Maq22A_c28155 [Methylobacterium aquaticum]
MEGYVRLPDPRKARAPFYPWRERVAAGTARPSAQESAA